MADNAIINQAIITGLTKYPRAELLGRYAAVAVGAATVGYAACYAVTKGFYVPDKDVVSLVMQTVAGIIVTAIATKLGLSAQQKSELTVVANTMAAAATGAVPEAIAAKATAEQIAAVQAAPNASVVAMAPLKPGA